jgi:hypothetical protein
VAVDAEQGEGEDAERSENTEHVIFSGCIVDSNSSMVRMTNRNIPHSDDKGDARIETVRFEPHRCCFSHADLRKYRLLKSVRDSFPDHTRV